MDATENQLTDAAECINTFAGKLCLKLGYHHGRWSSMVTKHGDLDFFTLTLPSEQGVPTDGLRAIVSEFGLIVSSKALSDVPPPTLAITYAKDAGMAMAALRADFQCQSIVLFNGADPTRISHYIDRGLRTLSQSTPIANGFLAAVYKEPATLEQSYQPQNKTLNSWPRNDHVNPLVWQKQQKKQQALEKELKRQQEEFKRQAEGQAEKCTALEEELKRQRDLIEEYLKSKPRGNAEDITRNTCKCFIQ